MTLVIGEINENGSHLLASILALSWGRINFIRLIVGPALLEGEVGGCSGLVLRRKKEVGGKGEMTRLYTRDDVQSRALR
jgi:hypothetical protein